MISKDIFFDTEEFEDTKEKLGEGTFGKVYIVNSLKDKKQYAAKIINSSNMADPMSQFLFMSESQILHKLDHPAIVKFFGINFHSFTNSTILEPTILTEYLPNKSLKEILDKEKRTLADKNWTATKKYICLLGISDALRYLHEQGILHYDIKPQNILIDKDFYPHVCDFGLSKCFSTALTNSMKLSMSGNVGTPLYMAPELYEDDDHFGPGIDVYAFSMLAYEIVTGQEPFSQKGKSTTFAQFTKIFFSGGRPDFPEFVTEKMKSLIQKCWSQNPTDRPSFKKIFELLSSDFSYINENMDEDEIRDYIEDLKEANSRPKSDDLKEANSQPKSDEFKKANSSKSDDENDFLSTLLFDTSDLNIDKKNINLITNIVKKEYVITSILGIVSPNDEKEFLHSVKIQASLKHCAIMPLIGYIEPNNIFTWSFVTPFMNRSN